MIYKLIDCRCSGCLL